MTDQNPEAAPVDSGKPAETIVTANAETTSTDKAWYSDDWLDKLSGQDEKAKNVFGRFKTPEDLAKTYLEINKKISAGELRSGLKENATPEEVAAWRSLNGIPESPDGYDLAFDNGMVIGEQDKPIIGEFLQEMHKANAHPSAVKTAVGAYYNIIQKEQTKQLEVDNNYKAESENSLKTEWGTDYISNVNMVKNLLAGAPEEIRESLLTARLGDGTVLGNNPLVLKYLHGLAKNPMTQGTITSASGGSPAMNINDEIASLEKKMRDDREGWFKDQKSQDRYRQLIATREKLK